MLKIRRSGDRLIFNMGIPIPGKYGLYIETGPRIFSMVEDALASDIPRQSSGKMIITEDGNVVILLENEWLNKMNYSSISSNDDIKKHKSISTIPKLIVTYWHHMVTYIQAITSANVGNDISLACCLKHQVITWTIIETSHQWDLVAFTWQQFHSECPSYYSVYIMSLKIIVL